MRNALVIALLVVILVTVAGCRSVWMNGETSSLLDRTAALATETAARAEQGKLSAAEMTTALSGQAKVWRRFIDLRDGRESAP